ncbi:MAG: mechanosensitive ion channel family protein [Duganella sp.]
MNNFQNNFQNQYQLSTWFTSIPLQDWIVAVAVGAVAFLVLHGIQLVVRKRLARLAASGGAAGGRSESILAAVLSATIGRTSNVFIVLVALLAGLSTLNLGPAWNMRIEHLWFIVIGVQVTIYLTRGIGIAIRRYFRSQSDDADAPLTVANTLVSGAIKTLLWTILLLSILSNAGVNITTFIASLGIGGIAIALAAQNILGDLFASLSIAVDKPFEVGDAINVLGVSGTVEHVGLKTTRIRADSGEQIVVSNTDLLKNVLRNYKRMATRRIVMSFRINPDTPAALAGQVPAMIRAIVEAQADIRCDRVHLKAVTPEAIEYELVFFVLTSNYLTYMDVQQTILLTTMERFAAMGISTSAPTRRLVVDSDPATRTALPAAAVTS